MLSSDMCRIAILSLLAESANIPLGFEVPIIL